MNKLRVILFLLLGFIWGQWSQINSPGGQPISRLIYDGEQLISATAFSELYTSYDDGNTWQALSPNDNLVPYGVDLLHKMGDYLFVSQNIFSDFIPDSTETPPVSVIVAIRNGQNSLPQLLLDLVSQDYSGKMEFILSQNFLISST